jgi:hypothetical protein
VLEQVNSLTDRLGKGIDPGIKHAVVAFNIAGFPTTMSCEGHMKQWGTPFPWVDLDLTDALRIKLESFMDKFYLTREKNMLCLKLVEGIRVQSSNQMPYSTLVKSYFRDETILAYARREMDAFADYLLELK